MFDITIEDPVTKEKIRVNQNSSGLTTRTIGVMVIVHGDNKGLVLPPKVAPIQVVIVPWGITGKETEEDKTVMDTCRGYETVLISVGIRVKGDFLLKFKENIDW